MREKLPFCLTLLGMMGGVFIAILFGVNEGIFKDKIAAQLEANPTYHTLTDPGQKKAKVKQEANKNWRYYQRYHFHATGIGAMALSVLLLLHFLVTQTKLKATAAYLVSIGGLLYPFIWLFAAMWGPEIGRGPAKEKFAIFGYMGGLFLIGLCLSLYLVIRHPLQKPLLNHPL